MTTAMARKPPLGSMEWLEASGGVLTPLERFQLLWGAIPAGIEGVGLWLRSRKNPGRKRDLSSFEAPGTPMITEARALLSELAHPAMANHAFRTAFRTLDVIDQHAELTDEVVETAWVAALLHDIGLDVAPPQGDFSAAGVSAVDELKNRVGWDDRQAWEAKQAIACNLGTGIRADELGVVAWAMNVGGLGEVTYGPHRALMHPDAAAELESRYPRTDFREVSLSLIKEEARRLPGGRFALARPCFYVMLRG